MFSLFFFFFNICFRGKTFDSWEKQKQCPLMPLCTMRFGLDYRWLHTDKYCHKCSSYTAVLPGHVQHWGKPEHWNAFSLLGVGKTRTEQQECSSIPPPARRLSLKWNWTEQYHGQAVTGSFFGLIWWEDGFIKYFYDGGLAHKIWCWEINSFACTFFSKIISFYLLSVMLNFQWKHLTEKHSKEHLN